MGSKRRKGNEGTGSDDKDQMLRRLAVSIAAMLPPSKEEADAVLNYAATIVGFCRSAARTPPTLTVVSFKPRD